MILVTGATGHIGREVVQRLSRAGHTVRALSRQPGQADLPPGVEVAEGSVTGTASFRSALDGADSLFLVLTGDVAGQAGHATAAIKTWNSSRQRKLVMLSSLSIAHPVRHAIGDTHRRAEHLIRSAAPGATFLRPGPFHTNALWWAKSIKEERRARCLIGNQPGAPIDPADVAAVAVTALTQDGHAGKAYPLTGPAVITSAEQVRLIGEILGCQIGFEVATEEAVVDTFTALTGDRESAVTNARALRSPQVPWAAPVPTVREVTGQPPRAFHEWAAQNAPLFR